jgi:hypothetical protein
MIDVNEPWDSNHVKPPNKSTITTLYKTLKLTKQGLASAKSQNPNQISPWNIETQQASNEFKTL